MKILLEGTTSEEEQSWSIRQEGRKKKRVIGKVRRRKEKRREEQRCREQGKMHLNYQKINKLESEKLKK